MLLSQLLHFRYENKGVAWKKSISTLPPGLAPSEAVESKAALSKNAKKKQKRKEKKRQENESAGNAHMDKVAEALGDVSLDNAKTTKDTSKDNSKSPDSMTPDEIQRKLRAARKKLKEIDALQAKIDSGEIKTPEQAQLDKIAKRDKFAEELAYYENLLA